MHEALDAILLVIPLRLADPSVRERLEEEFSSDAGKSIGLTWENLEIEAVADPAKVARQPPVTPATLT